jgi:hypothetical protein
MRCCLFLLATLAATCLVVNAAFAGPFDALLPYVPAEANALVFLNPAKVRSSEFAKANLLDEFGAAAQAAGSTLASPVVEHSLVAARIDFSTLQPTWTTAIAATNRDVAIANLGGRSRHESDSIGGLEANALPGDGFLVRFSPRVVGAVVPDDRQFATRWVRNGSAKRRPALSPYLEKACEYANDLGTELVAAFDADGLLGATRVRERLPKTEAFQKQSVSLKDASNAIASLEGVTLGVRFRDKANGKLRFDFTSNPAILNNFAKPLALEALNQAGMMIDDFAVWQASIEGNSVFLSGDFSPRGLRQFLSLLETPLRLEEGGPPGADSQDKQVITKNTLENFKTIQILMRDARYPEAGQQTGAMTSGSYAQWLDRYAKKIDRLPVVQVDEDMINFAATTAQQLRSMAVSYRGVGIKASVYSANITWDFNYYPWYGNWWASRNIGLSDHLQAKRNERASVSLSAAQMWPVMDDALQQLRIVLSKRYQVEFR